MSTLIISACILLLVVVVEELGGGSYEICSIYMFLFVQIALVMTDGRQAKGEDAPDAKELHLASRGLKEAGVQVYSLGIGRDYDIGELLDIASDDQSVFRSSDVDELVSIVAQISEQACKGILLRLVLFCLQLLV